MLCWSIFHIRAIHGIFKNSGIWGIAFSDQIRKIPMGSRKFQEAANLGKGLDGAPFEATHLNLGAICGIDLQRSVHHQDI